MVGKSLGGAAQAALVCHVAKRAMKDFFEKSFLREVEIVSFRDDTLFVMTPNSTYSQEIKMKEKNILDKANSELRQNLIGKIRFKVPKQTL